MKLKVVLISLILLFSIAVKAQVQTSVSVQLGIAKITSSSAQGMFTFLQKLTEHFVITAGIGWSEYYGGFKTLGLDKYSYAPRIKVKSAVPLRIGGRYYYSNEGFNPCIILEWGINRLDEELKIPISGVPGQSPAEFISDDRTVYDISYGIGFGALIPLLDRLNVDINFIAHQKMMMGDYVSLMVGANYLL